MPNDTPIPIRPATGPVPGTGGGGPLAQLSYPARQTAAAALQGEHEPATSLYVHTPFCVHKCHYCDFYSFVDQRDQQGAFVERLIEELRAQAPLASGAPLVSGVPSGGNNPSLMVGSAGVGHFLLRLHDARRVPSVLIVDPAGVKEGL